MSSTKATQPKRKRLHRDQIVAAAIDLADQAGLDAISMRALAGQLECGVMSLYNHVRDKDDLYDAMVDQAAASIELPAEIGDPSAWPDQLRDCAISAYRVMITHRWLPKLWNRWPGHNKNRYHEAILRIMRQAGVPEELSCRGFHAITMHVYGFALQVVDMPFTNNTELRELGRNALTELAPAEFPYLIEHVNFHLDGRDQRSDFKYMLDLIIDGLSHDVAMYHKAADEH